MLTGRGAARVALLAVCTACVGSTRDVPSPAVVEAPAALRPPPADEPSAQIESIETPTPPSTVAPIAEAATPPPSIVVVRRAGDVATGRVVVRLRTWADEPIVEAEVAAAPQAADGLHWPWWGDPKAGRERFAESVERATTDAAGEATFEGVPVGTWSFVADATGFATLGRTIRVWARPLATITLRLEPGASLRGRVLDSDGAPSPGATVILGRWNGFDLWRPFRVLADGEGRFAFDGVPSGDRSLYVGPSGKPAFRVGRASVPDVHDIDVRLPRPSVARGVVVDADTGRPIEGARICAGHGDSSFDATTGADGRYEFVAVAPENEFLVIRADEDVWLEVHDPSVRATSLRLRPGGVVIRDFRLRRAGKAAPASTRSDPSLGFEEEPATDVGLIVRGRVRTAAGASTPPGTRVQAIWNGRDGGGMQWTGWTPVSDDGSFVARVPADAVRFFVRAGAPGVTPFFWDAEPFVPHPSDSPTIDVVPGRTTYELEAPLAPGEALVGRVVAKDTGAPVAGAWVLLRYCCIIGSWANPVRAMTDADGRFRIAGVAKFRWPVGVEAEGFVTTAVFVEPGAAPTTIALERELSIEGFVRFADGRPAVGAVVNAVRGESPPLNGSSRDDRSRSIVDSAGRFRVAELPSGRYALQVGPDWGDGFVVPKKVLDVATGSTGVEIVVDRAK